MKRMSDRPVFPFKRGETVDWRGKRCEFLALQKPYKGRQQALIRCPGDNYHRVATTMLIPVKDES